MSRTRKTALPDWFPLPIYRQTLTNDEWLTEVGLRAALQTIDKNRREGKTGGLTTSRPVDETFRSLFVTRESRPEGNLAKTQERNFWPIRDPTVFELLFLVENQRVAEHAEAEAWAKRLNAEGKNAIAEYYYSGMRDKIDSIERDISKEPSIDVYMEVLANG